MYIPILPKTTALVAEHLILDLTDIVISYFRAKRRTWKHIMLIGEYETCLEYPRNVYAMKNQLFNPCRGGHKEIVELMITFGFTSWNHGLQGACQGGHKELVDFMIECGANNFCDAAKGACDGGHLELAKTMFSLGNIKIPLYSSCRGGNQKIVDFAIDNGSVLFDHGLYGACRGGHLELAKLMISNGARITSYTFEKACRGGNPEIVKLLMSSDVEITPNACWSAGRSCNMEVIKMVTKGDTTSIMHAITGACKSCNMNVIKHFLPTEIDQDWLDECLVAACQWRNSLDVAKFFISRGANDFNRCLREACEHGHRETAALMISCGATKCSSCERPIKYHN